MVNEEYIQAKEMTNSNIQQESNKSCPCTTVHNSTTPLCHGGILSDN